MCCSANHCLTGMPKNLKSIKEQKFYTAPWDSIAGWSKGRDKKGGLLLLRKVNQRVGCRTYVAFKENRLSCN